MWIRILLKLQNVLIRWITINLSIVVVYMIPKVSPVIFQTWKQIHAHKHVKEVYW